MHSFPPREKAAVSAISAWLGIAAVAASMALCVPMNARADDDAAARLIERLHAFLDGAARNDAEVHDRFWAEDVVYTSSSGERFGKQRIMDGLDPAAPTGVDALPRYHGEDVHVRLEGNALGVVTFRLVAELSDGTRAQYFNTGVFRRTDGQWRAFAWQATRIPGEADE